MKPWVIGAAALVASIALAMACGGSSTKSNLEGVQYAVTAGPDATRLLAKIPRIFWMARPRRGCGVRLTEEAYVTGTSHKVQLLITGLTSGKKYWFRVKAYLRNDTWTDYRATVDLVIP